MTASTLDPADDADRCARDEQEPVVLEIIVHPFGRLDDGGGDAGFWAEVPSLPDCGGIAAHTPEEAFALTVSEVSRWCASRRQAVWQPVPDGASFVAVHAW